MTNWLHRWRHRAQDAELAEEMRLHQEERAAELIASGLAADEARWQARREFGSALKAIEDSNAAWHLGWLEDLWNDLRHGLRGLRRDPSFTVVSVLSLALAIGVNTFIFSLAMEFFFSRPSVRDAATVMNLRLGGDSHAEPADYRVLRDARVFEGVAGLRTNEINWRDGERSTRLFATHVTRNYFSLLGVPLERGRGILESDGAVVVLSNRFWRLRLNSDPGVLGRTMWLDGVAHTVTGVLPDDLRTPDGFGFSPHVWVPADEQKAMLSLYVRRPADMTPGEARARAMAFAAAQDAAQPKPRQKRTEGLQLNGVTGFERLGGKNMATALLFLAMLLAAVNLVLLIACVNVAGLLLARGQARAQEFAVRTSLGASRGRLVRQVLAETLLVALGATLLGVTANLALTRGLGDLQLPVPVPIYLRIYPDFRLLAYSAALAILSAVAAGLAPAWQTARASLLARGSRQTESGGRLRTWLVGAQVSVTFVVLAAAFLFIRNLTLAASTPTGFEADRVLWASVRPADGQKLATTTLERLRALPGVESVSRVRTVPLNDQTTHRSTVNGIAVRYQYNEVSPEYFKTMGIALLAGREFQEGERDAAVINETLARRVFGRLDVAGQALRLGETRTVTVIGVCRTSKYFLLSEDDQPALYGPYREEARTDWMIRTRPAPATLVRGVEKLLLAQDPAASVEVKPMNMALGMALLPSQIGAGLMGSLGVLGLALASLGLYGVLLHTVARRQRELGVRIALGAGARAVVGLVMREVSGIVGVGLGIGMVVAVLVTRPLAAFLIAGLSPADPATYALVALAFTLVALAAAGPAVLRALRVDPCEVLRVD